MNSQTSLRDDCSHEGLSCDTCVEFAARNLASVCVELEGKALERLYLQLYTKRGCRRMFRSFEALYLQKTEEVLIEISAAEAPVRTVARCA